MQVITSVKEMQQLAKDLRKEGKTIGFVPTMGYLHEGHVTLLKQSVGENEISVLSIFVNPLQFGPNEDFETYPRDRERDEKLAAEVGVDYLFYPSVEEMYPTSATLKMTVTKRTDVLCGQRRPGHFDGVVTVLAKLFNIVLPDKVYMGTKDAQQVAVVQGLVDDYNIPVQIIPVETVRESDGLAKSSRNVYLSPEEREEAVALSQSLQAARTAIEKGERNPQKLLEEIRATIQSQTSGEIDYAEIYFYPSLEVIDNVENQIIIALAVKFSKARLIDNLIMTVPVDKNKGEKMLCSVQ